MHSPWANGNDRRQIPPAMNHFADMTWFALVLSVALSLLGRRTPRERLRYAIVSFAAFVLLAVAVGWLMYPFSR
jgi:hypothetical protein